MLVRILQWELDVFPTTSRKIENAMSYAIRVTIGWILIVIAAGLWDPVEGAVLISELMADPQSDWNNSGVPNYRDDEWIEVINTGSEAEDLSQYYLRDITDETPHLQLSGMLEPGATALFFGSDAMAWQQANGSTQTGFSLNNDGDTVELVTLLGEGYLVLDIVTYTDHEAEDDRSSGRDPETGDWMLYDGLNPHSGSQEPLGTDCLPTPGEANLCAPNVPVDLETWDAVKSLYK
jgi:hypothetical protein